MSALGRSRRRTGPATDRGLDFHAGNPLSSLFAHGQEQDLPGSLAIHPVTLRRSTTPDDPLRLAISGASGAAPTRLTMKASSFTISRLGVASSPAVYASRRALPHAMQDSLPAGGLRLCRAGVEPAGSLREVSDHLILLPRAFPGAIRVPSGRGIGDIGIIIPIELRSRKGTGNALCHALSSLAWRFSTRISAPT